MIRQRGVSLIETLVYLALFAIIMSGIMASAYGLFMGSDRAQTKAMLQEELNFLTAKVVNVLNNAETISWPASGNIGTTLTITRYDSSSQSMSLSGGNLLLGSAQLNNSNVTLITASDFEHIYDSTLGTHGVVITLVGQARDPHGRMIELTNTKTHYIRK